MVIPDFENLNSRLFTQIQNNLYTTNNYKFINEERELYSRSWNKALHKICASDHMFKKEIWDKLTEFTFLKFWNLPSERREVSKFQKMNEVNFPQISRINIWFLVNHMWQALNKHTRIGITQKTINQYQQIYSITSTLQ